MTDYFCFPNVKTWTDVESLKAEGFVRNETPIFAVAEFMDIYSYPEIFRTIQDSSYFFTRLDGLDVQHAIIVETGFQNAFVPHLETVVPNLHTLIFDRYQRPHYTLEEKYFNGKCPVKRLDIRRAFRKNHYIFSPERKEQEFLSSVMNLELDYLWLEFDLDNTDDWHVEMLGVCKAKSLNIIVKGYNGSYPHKPFLEEIFGLKNLSTLIIGQQFAPYESDVKLDFPFESILLLRSETLENVIVEKLEDTRFICSSEILNNTLHDLLLDVCIAFASAGLALYELYFILEYLPPMRGHKRFKVVASLEKIRLSIAKVKKQRNLGNKERNIES